MRVVVELLSLWALPLFVAACSTSSAPTSTGGGDAAVASSGACTGDPIDARVVSAGSSIGRSVYGLSDGGVSIDRENATAKTRGSMGAAQRYGGCRAPDGVKIGDKPPGAPATGLAECKLTCCPCASGPRGLLANAVIDGQCASVEQTCALTMEAVRSPTTSDLCGSTCAPP